MRIPAKSNLIRKASSSWVGFVSFSVSIVFGLASAAQLGALPQAQDPAATTPVYDVVSIKPSRPTSFGVNADGSMSGAIRRGLRYTADGFVAENTSVKSLIQTAFGVGNDRVSGGPDWIDSEKYDIQAKIDDPVVIDWLQKLATEERNLVRQRMLQALLADRFKLTVQHDSKELPVYLLIVGKNGPKFRESKSSDPPQTETKGPDASRTPDGPPIFIVGPDGKPRVNPASIPKGTTQMSFGSDGMLHLTGPNTTIPKLVGTLTAQLHRPVLDKTGLVGNYDIELKWVPDQMPIRGSSTDSDVSGPTLQKAVEDQLGLKLESGKAPIEIIAISHVERPSKN